MTSSLSAEAGVADCGFWDDRQVERCRGMGMQHGDCERAQVLLGCGRQAEATSGQRNGNAPGLQPTLGHEGRRLGCHNELGAAVQVPEQQTG